MTFWGGIALSAAITGLILSGWCFIKKKSFKLGLVMIFFTLFMSEQTVIFSNYHISYPHILFISLPFLYLIGPAISLHIEQFIPRLQSRPVKWIRFILPFIILIYMMPVYSLPADAKILYHNHFVEITSGKEAFKLIAIYFLLQLQLALFLFQTLRKIEKAYPGSNKMSKMKRLLRMMVLWLIALAFLQTILYNSQSVFIIFNYVFMLTMIILMLLFGIIFQYPGSSDSRNFNYDN